MNILIANDDGIKSEGLAVLAKLASKLGKVTVVAPYHEQSGKSQAITYNQWIPVRKHDFAVEGVKAYSVDGTPADCVSAGIECLVDEKPDYVFTGINDGYNVGFDILYSGTDSGAREAALLGVKAIAFSQFDFESFDLIERYFDEIFEILSNETLEYKEFFNVNFPNCAPDEVKGIQFCKPDDIAYYTEGYYYEELGDRMGQYMRVVEHHPERGVEGKDICSLKEGYITISKLSAVGW